MDELLLHRAQRGDPDAFEQLMGPLEQLIWRSLENYRGECALESWVYRIAANCCMDFLRKKKRDQSVSMEPLKEQGFDPADPSPGTEEQVVAAEEKKRLREAITLLPEDQREALIMTQLEKVPYEEAAKLLGTSEGTVKSRINRAKARLKEILSEAGELSPPGNVQRDERRLRS